MTISSMEMIVMATITSRLKMVSMTESVFEGYGLKIRLPETKGRGGQTPLPCLMSHIL